MMYEITALVAGAGGSAGLFGLFRYLQKNSAQSVGNLKVQLENDIEAIDKEVEELFQYRDSFASNGQYDSLSGQVDALKNDLEKEKAALVELEGTLNTAQTNVEQKEAVQQEIKSAKEEDELKLEELLAAYNEISDEAISLEQQLAQSMKNLDAIQAEVDLTDEQKAVVEELGEALSLAGETLRNLLTDYQSVNERLQLLREQHEDLEEEYTKLVEQQLGE